MTNEKLEEIKKSVLLTKELSNDDSYITIFNSEGAAMAFFPAKNFSLHVELGGKPPAGDKIYEVLRTKRPITNTIPKEVLGVAISAKIIPLLDNNELIGAIAYACSTEKVDEIYTHSSELTEQLEDTKGDLKTILTSIESL